MPNDTKTVNTFPVSVAQMRAARALLSWSQTDLAAAAGMSEPTVKRFETGRGARVSDEAVAKLRVALESAGVIFLENGEGPGVKLKKRAVSKAAVSKG